MGFPNLSMAGRISFNFIITWKVYSLKEEEIIMKRVCPKCKKEITYLTSTTPGILLHYLSIDTQGDVQFEVGEFESGDAVVYDCPECGEVLFTNEEEVIAFLKGE